MVFDGCHSGTVTRSLDGADEEVRTRQLPPQALAIDPVAVEGLATRSIGDPRKTEASFDATSGESSLVAFFAAQTTEVTPERNLPEDEVHLLARNNTDGPVDVNVLYIGADWSISHWFAGRLQPGDELKKCLFKISDQVLGQERMLVVLSPARRQSPVEDLSWLAQAALDTTRSLGGSAFGDVLAEAGFGMKTRGAMPLSNDGDDAFPCLRSCNWSCVLLRATRVQVPHNAERPGKFRQKRQTPSQAQDLGAINTACFMSPTPSPLPNGSFPKASCVHPVRAGRMSTRFRPPSNCGSRPTVRRIWRRGSRRG